jgi:hypothetical protein
MLPTEASVRPAAAPEPGMTLDARGRPMILATDRLLLQISSD